MTRPGLLIGAATIIVVASLWYVQAPPRSPGGYRDRVSASAETLRSQVQTARLTIRAVRSGDSTHPAASVSLKEAEEDADKAAAAFAGYDPPRGTSDLRSDLTTLGDEVTSALSDLRIAAARGEWQSLPQVAAPLPKLSERLDQLARRAGS